MVLKNNWPHGSGVFHRNRRHDSGVGPKNKIVCSGVGGLGISVKVKTNQILYRDYIYPVDSFKIVYFKNIWKTNRQIHPLNIQMFPASKTQNLIPSRSFIIITFSSLRRPYRFESQHFRKKCKIWFFSMLFYYISKVYSRNLSFPVGPVHEKRAFF